MDWIEGGCSSRGVPALEMAVLVQEHADLHEALVSALAWIDAVPDDVVLPAMPGFDRDSVDELVARAAQ